MNIYTTISKRVKSLMSENNLLQKQIATDLNINVSTLNSYFTNRLNWNIETIIQTADYFNVSIEYILGLTDVKENTSITTFNLIKLENKINDMINESENITKILSDLKLSIEDSKNN